MTFLYLIQWKIHHPAPFYWRASYGDPYPTRPIFYKRTTKRMEQFLEWGLFEGKHRKLVEAAMKEIYWATMEDFKINIRRHGPYILFEHGKRLNFDIGMPTQRPLKIKRANEHIAVVLKYVKLYE